MPEKAETLTANVAIYNVIKVLSQYSDNAIKRIKLPTIKQDLIPPIISVSYTHLTLPTKRIV